MGRPRAKLKLEQISDEKKRITTFKKRKEGLIKKMHEITTLCDVNGCIIAYGPNGSTEPEIWPKDSVKFQQVIDRYKIAKTKDSGVKSSGLADFFNEKIRKAEEEIAIAKKKNLELKYPFHPEVINSLNEVQSTEFADFLKHKVESVKSRIDFLNKSRDNLVVESKNFNDPMEISSVDHLYNANQCQFGEVQKMNQNNSMTMLLMNGNYENDLLCEGNYEKDLLYNQLAHGVNPTTYQNAGPVSSCSYQPGMSLLPSPYVQFGMIS